MVFAGPVFTEWYWGPIFLIVVCAPAMAGAFVVAYVTLRRRTTRWRLAIAVAAALAVPVVVALALQARQSRDVRETNVANRERVDFATFLSPRLPGRYELRESSFGGGRGAPYLYLAYTAGDGDLVAVAEQRFRGGRLADGYCDVRDLAATGTTFVDGGCEQARTANGRTVSFVRDDPAAGGTALTVVGDTLVVVRYRSLTRADVLAYVAGLRPVPPQLIPLR